PSQPSSSLLPPPSPPPPPPSFPTRRSSDLRFYDVTGGAIRIGGHDVRDLTTDSLRAAIGLVPEDSFLFSDTVRDNIAYGHPDATDRKSTRLNSSHVKISYAVFCLKKKNKKY